MSHDATVQTVMFSPDGATILSGGRDDTARIWGADLLTPEHTVISRNKPVICVAADADGRRLLVDSDAGYSLFSGDPLTGRYSAQPLPRSGYGRSAAFSPDPDVYATGVLLCEMFCGKLPFTGANTMEIYLAQMQAMPIKPSEHWAEIPPALEAIILKCIEKDPANRYQSVQELGIELAKLRA